MKPIVLTAEQRREIERRRKDTLDRRVYQRLTAVLAVAAGKTREEVAELLGVSLSQLGEWLRSFRNEGLDALCEIHNKGDPGKRTPQQIEQLKAQLSTGLLPQLRPDPRLDQIRLLRQLLFLRGQGPAQAHRRQLPQGERLLVEGGPRRAARLRQARRAAPARGEGPRRAADAPLLRRCLPPRLGPGPGVLLLAAARPAVAGGHGLRPQAAEHPRRLLPRRPRVPRLPADARQHQRRAVRQLPAVAAVAASGGRALHPVRGRGALLRQPGRQGVVEAASGVPPLADPGVLAQRQPDRAAVEVHASQSAVPLAPDV